MNRKKKIMKRTLVVGGGVCQAATNSGTSQTEL